ncbi:hypothetical protein Pmani_038785 [Petrolisthes manimaculis]|uniref:Uncharacterized protein n=1 Tax=Petrolisthes manimaculis TaxID=1843537 RepID=A0AAE1NFK2_9EUCA|nr:hypothetical protein Pmani_038785 [Petrolisthes manimaculis]
MTKHDRPKNRRDFCKASSAPTTRAVTSSFGQPINTQGNDDVKATHLSAVSPKQTSHWQSVSEWRWEVVHA